jgi:hypothetical protein
MLRSGPSIGHSLRYSERLIPIETIGDFRGVFVVAEFDPHSRAFVEGVYVFRRKRSRTLNRKLCFLWSSGSEEGLCLCQE